MEDFIIISMGLFTWVIAALGTLMALKVVIDIWRNK